MEKIRLELEEKEKETKKIEEQLKELKLDVMVLKLTLEKSLQSERDNA